MRKRIALVVALMLAVLAMVGVGQVDAAMQLRFGHIQSEQDMWHLSSLNFKEEVERLSNGSMTVVIFPTATLGGDRDMAEGLQMGTLDFSLIAGVLGNFEPTMQLLELPYLFESQEEFSRVIHGPIGEEIAQNVLGSSGIRILTWWNRGPRVVTSNKPINSLADIQGLKIRLPEIPAMVETWRVMGATPTPMAWAEVYSGLEQNVIEAQENPIPFIYGGRIHEVQKYIAMTNHKYEYVTIAMSEIRWQALNDEQRKVVVEAARISAEYKNQLLIERTQAILDEIVAGGLTVTHPNKDEFAAVARSVHENFAKTVNIGLYNRIMETIGTR